MADRAFWTPPDCRSANAARTLRKRRDPSAGRHRTPLAAGTSAGHSPHRLSCLRLQRSVRKAGHSGAGDRLFPKRPGNRETIRRPPGPTSARDSPVPGGPGSGTEAAAGVVRPHGDGRFKCHERSSVSERDLVSRCAFGAVDEKRTGPGQPDVCRGKGRPPVAAALPGQMDRSVLP